MGEVIHYIDAHWVEWLFVAISTLLGYGYHQISKRQKEENKKSIALHDGVLALLHDRLYQACQYYLKKGYCNLDDRDNLEYMFRPYKALGGNGTGEELYNRCLALPYGPEKEEKSER